MNIITKKMTHTSFHIDIEACPIKKAMEVVAGKWKMLIIFNLGENTVRYGELKRGIEGISEKVLIQELKALADQGIVERISYGEVPPRVEYKLTEKGRKALPLIQSIRRFGEDLLA
jgi:DNA-binding HxlR family transcriptional regulator